MVIGLDPLVLPAGEGVDVHIDPCGEPNLRPALAFPLTANTHANRPAHVHSVFPRTQWSTMTAVSLLRDTAPVNPLGRPLDHASLSLEPDLEVRGLGRGMFLQRSPFLT